MRPWSLMGGQPNLYKVLGRDMESIWGGDHAWVPGEWTPYREIDPCKSGWHLCAGERCLAEWLGPQIWRAEYRGEIVDARNGKMVAESMRITHRCDGWNEESARALSRRWAQLIFQSVKSEEDLVDGKFSFPFFDLDPFVWARSLGAMISRDCYDSLHLPALLEIERQDPIRMLKGAL